MSLVSEVKVVGGAASAVLLSALLLIVALVQTCASYEERVMEACARSCGERGVMSTPSRSGATCECRP